MASGDEGASNPPPLKRSSNDAKACAGCNVQGALARSKAKRSPNDERTDGGSEFTNANSTLSAVAKPANRTPTPSLAYDSEVAASRSTSLRWIEPMAEGSRDPAPAGPLLAVNHR